MQIPEDQFRPSKSASLEVDFRNLHCNSFPSGFMHIKICNLKGGMYREERKEIVLTICTLACSVTQLCLTLWNPMDCSLPGSSVHGISQARILEWVAISSSRGSSQPRDRTWVSCIADGDAFTCWGIIMEGQEKEKKPKGRGCAVNMPSILMSFKL